MRSPTKVAVMFGTRPEAIKVAPVVRELQARADLEPVVFALGQHREMLAHTVADLGMVIDHHVPVDRASNGLAELSVGVLSAVDRAISRARPELLLVQGDTTSAFCAALVAEYHRIPVVHLEAGLRVDRENAPMPEEMNRRLIGQLAALHLAPTTQAWTNLMREGVDGSKVFVVGNTVIDALHWAIEQDPQIDDPRLAEAVANPAGLVLVTAHRRESWGEPMDRIAAAVSQLARRWQRVPFVVPMHANPLVRASLKPALSHLPNVVLAEPLPYLQFTKVMKHARLILTDSGGVQEEASALNIPTLVLRDSTEREEALRSQIAMLVGTEIGSIVGAAAKLGVGRPGPAKVVPCPYGDGFAAQRSVDAMGWFLDGGLRPSNYLAPALRNALAA